MDQQQHWYSKIKIVFNKIDKLYECGPKSSDFTMNKQLKMAEGVHVVKCF